MNNYYILSNSNSKYGYDFVEEHSDGTTIVTELRSKTTDGYLRFPQNDYGQKMIAIKKLVGHDRYDLEPYTGHRSASTSSEPKADAFDALLLCLDGTDREVFAELLAKARERLGIFKRKEALRKQIEKAQQALAELE